MRRALPIALAALALPACTNGLDPSSIVVTPRILAVLVDHPEAAPGEPVRFHAMISVPEDVPRPLEIRWRACLDAESVLSETGFDVDLPGPRRCETVTLPAEEPLRLEGASSEMLVAQLRAFATVGGFDPALIETILSSAGLAYVVELEVLDADGVVRVAGYKRAAITTRAPPTTNPPPPVFAMDDHTIVATEEPFRCIESEGGEIVLARDADVDLAPLLPEGAAEEPWLETFPIFDYTGGITQGRENAYYSWFATAGRFSEETSRPPNRGTVWRSPAEPGVHTIWLVIRDGHLGTSACRIAIRVE